MQGTFLGPWVLVKKRNHQAPAFIDLMFNEKEKKICSKVVRALEENEVRKKD